MADVTLIDYGVGNIKAFANIYLRLGLTVQVATSAACIRSSNRLVLPGVGAFDWAMKKLTASGMRDALDFQVLENRTPVIGVCVGMQMMAKSSDEGQLEGLGWLDAHVAKFSPPSNQNLPLPHMGWNDVSPTRTDGIFGGISDPRFYFLHSYIFVPFDAADILAETEYCGRFVSAVQRNNVFGTQFHPEKSHQWGISLLENFAALPTC